MKKILVVLASLLLVSGCSDAYANLKDGSTEVFKVGSKTVTKEDMYQLMKNSSGAYYVLNDATGIILDKEIEVSDAMRKEAEDTLTIYKDMYGESFTQMLEAYGFKDEEDYVNNAIFKSKQLTELVKKYGEDNFDAMVEKYAPRKALVLSTDTTDDADAAFTELKGGTEPEEVIGAYNLIGFGEDSIILSEDDYPAEVKAILLSNTDDEWVKVPASDGNTYLIKVTESDPANIKDEFLDELAMNTEVQEASDHFYFDKYGFTIYDKDLYDAFKDNYPNYLVQK